MDTNRTNVVRLVPKRNKKDQERIETKEKDSLENKPKFSVNSEKSRGKCRRFMVNFAAYTGIGLVGILRYTAFFVLSVLRFPVRLICTLFVFAAIIGIPIVLLGLDQSHSMKTPALIFMSFGVVIASCIAWLYDSLLLKVAPQNMMLST